MVKVIGGFRRKTRHKLKKNIRTKGKISISNFLKNYENGDKVALVAEPAYQEGMYYPRFHGKHGVISGKMGDCYQVQIKDGNKAKTLTVHPVHLRGI